MGTTTQIAVPRKSRSRGAVRQGLATAKSRTQKKPYSGNDRPGDGKAGPGAAAPVILPLLGTTTQIAVPRKSRTHGRDEARLRYGKISGPGDRTSEIAPESLPGLHGLLDRHKQSVNTLVRSGK